LARGRDDGDGIDGSESRILRLCERGRGQEQYSSHESAGGPCSSLHDSPPLEEREGDTYRQLIYIHSPRRVGRDVLIFSASVPCHGYARHTRYELAFYGYVCPVRLLPLHSRKIEPGDRAPVDRGISGTIMPCAIVVGGEGFEPPTPSV